jgi:hypothetical protein
MGIDVLAEILMVMGSEMYAKASLFFFQLMLIN